MMSMLQRLVTGMCSGTELCIAITMVSYVYLIILLCFQYILYHSNKSEILCNINYLQISKFYVIHCTFHTWNIKKTLVRVYWTDKDLETSSAITQSNILCYVIIKLRLLHYSLMSIAFFPHCLIFLFFSDTVFCKEK